MITDFFETKKSIRTHLTSIHSCVDGAGTDRFVPSVPSDNGKEQRCSENGNCGDPDDPCGILCGLAQGMGGFPHKKSFKPHGLSDFLLREFFYSPFFMFVLGFVGSSLPEFFITVFAKGSDEAIPWFFLYSLGDILTID